MDKSLTPRDNTDTPPRPTRPDLDSWRGDIREQPPAWRRRPRSRRMRELWDATRPLIANLGEGRSWD
jgi:hypothetical protein